MCYVINSRVLLLHACISVRIQTFGLMMIVLTSSNNYYIFIFQDKTSLLDKMQEEKIEQLVSFNKMSIVHNTKSELNYSLRVLAPNIKVSL